MVSQIQNSNFFPVENIVFSHPKKKKKKKKKEILPNQKKRGCGGGFAKDNRKEGYNSLRERNITKPKVTTAKTIVTEYPFWRIAIGSSTIPITPESRLPRMDRIPTDDTTRSNEWTTRGNRINPDGSACNQ